MWSVAVLVAIGAALACYGVRREPVHFRRRLLWTLRILAALVALFFLFEPGTRNVQVARAKNRVAILVDRSASMEFPSDRPKETRTGAVARALTALTPEIDAARERFAFESYGFSPELTPITPDVLREQPARAGRTDVLSALRSTMAGQGGASKLSGVILFSDGADNSELAGGISNWARTFIQESGVPISTVAVGTTVAQDIAVESVKVDDFAFVRNAITTDVEIRARGCKGQSTRVVLRSEGRIVGAKTLTFDSEDDHEQVSFTFSPDQTGRFVYTVSAAALPDERIVDNNSRSFSLKVIRDRVRVLLVAGRPSWDERFVRGVLRQDANVDLVSFYILRSATDDSNVVDDSRELSLIPFPREEIFRSKLGTFDLLVVLNFGHEDPQVALGRYREDIESYVKNGGAVAYLGGDRSFGDIAAAGDPFGQIMPVDAAGASDEAPFVAALTAEGRRHPVTTLDVNQGTLEALWSSMPAISGLNRTRPKTGATVLLEHPTLLVDGRKAPVLAVQQIGRGRVLALMTDGSWHWAFPAHAGGAGSRFYERFWSQAIRWLVRDPDLTPLQVKVDSSTVEPGRPVVASLVARTHEYQGAQGAEVAVELVDAEDGTVAARQNVVAGPDGVVQAEFAPPKPGAYKIRARAQRGEELLGEGTDVVAVRASGPELSEAHVNTALLRNLAVLSGGAFLDGPKVSLSDIPLKEPRLIEVGRSKELPIWDRWYWLFLVACVLGLEWAVRRRFGYI
jgi:uncharacterized membrane protein